MKGLTYWLEPYSVCGRRHCWTLGKCPSLRTYFREALDSGAQAVIESGGHGMESMMSIPVGMDRACSCKEGLPAQGGFPPLRTSRPDLFGDTNERV
jgi:hypothetical protein